MNKRLTRAILLIRILAGLYIIPAGYFLWWFIDARIDGYNAYGFDLLGLFFSATIASFALVTAWCAKRLKHRRPHAWSFGICILILHSFSLLPLPLTVPALLALAHPETRSALRKQSNSEQSPGAYSSKAADGLPGNAQE
ncbi:MAG: hypothetical protein JXQ75_12210 [Phycisphaerae bacterium]|nr:hypothetical protein [Phycisphaerae bacterium]